MFKVKGTSLKAPARTIKERSVNILKLGGTFEHFEIWLINFIKTRELPHFLTLFHKKTLTNCIKPDKRKRTSKLTQKRINAKLGYEIYLKPSELRSLTILWFKFLPTSFLYSYVFSVKYLFENYYFILPHQSPSCRLNSEGCIWEKYSGNITFPVVKCKDSLPRNM